jgi:integrase
VKGLRVRVGKNKTSWTFFQQLRFRGKRSTICKNLGTWPLLSVADARKEALQIAARSAAGRPDKSKREAVTLASAMDEYVAYLREQSKRKGKKPNWAQVVQSYARKRLLPVFGSWTLAELSNAPAAVRDFHHDVTKEGGPISANACVRILRAVYKHAAKLDRGLPAQLPTSAVQPNVETPSDKGLAFDQFSEWKAALDKVENPIRRSYYVIQLLTGCRPGELSKLKWADVLPRERVLVIRAAKAGVDIRLPLSREIVRELRRLPHGDGAVFPGCAHVRNFDDGLPVRGHGLRRTYRTVCADLGINEVLVRLLMGHSLVGVNQSYVNTLIMTGGPGLRAAQAKISKRIVSLLSA